VPLKSQLLAKAARRLSWVSSGPTKGNLIIPSIPTPNGNGTSSLKTIFVLDDDQDSLNVLHWVLERHYTVVKTDNADHAIDVCQNPKDQISLIVADILLRSPVSGTQVCLEARSCYPGIPILLTSGTPPEGWREVDFENFKVLMSGRVDFLQKPFTASTLESKIEKLLNGGWSTAEVQALYEDAEAYRRTGSK